MIKKIESENNKIIKLLKALSKKKHRNIEGIFIGEGERLVKDAAKRLQPKMLILSESYYDKNPDIDTLNQVYLVPDKIYKHISQTESPQGIMAVFPMLHKPIEQIRPGSILILDSVSDPGNVGTLIRTAAALGFSSVVLNSYSADIYNPKTVRSTMSAMFIIDIHISDSLKDDFKFLNKEREIYALHLSEGGEKLHSVSFAKAAGLIIGNEARGISKELLDCCDHLVAIPMNRGIESLNAAAAGAMAMYELFRQGAVLR